MSVYVKITVKMLLEIKQILINLHANITHTQHAAVGIHSQEYIPLNL